MSSIGPMFAVGPTLVIEREPRADLLGHAGLVLLDSEPHGALARPRGFGVLAGGRVRYGQRVEVARRAVAECAGCASSVRDGLAGSIGW